MSRWVSKRLGQLQYGRRRTRANDSGLGPDWQPSQLLKAASGIGSRMTAAVGVLIPRDIAAGRFVEYVQRAEERGFQELWVVEDCCYRGGIAQAAVALSFTTDAADEEDSVDLG